MKNNGLLFVFEGADGCGKSTIHQAAIDHLKESGKDVISVRDPGGTIIGQEIRKILLNPDYENMNPSTELLLYIASRAQLVQEIVKPSLDSGKIVLSDRFTLSTLVYQGLTGKWEEKELNRLVKVGLQGISPKAVFLFDVDTEIAMKRLGSSLDRMEKKGLEFQKRVRKSYLKVGRKYFRNELHVIDSSKSIDDVKKKVFKILDFMVRFS